MSDSELLKNKLIQLLNNSIILDRPTTEALKGNVHTFSEGMIQDLIMVLEKANNETNRLIDLALKNDSSGEYLQKLKTILSVTAKAASGAEEQAQAIDPEAYLNEQLKEL